MPNGLKDRGAPAIAVTGSMLYSLVTCPHRVTMDLFEDPAKRDEVNAFVELLWERGSAVEKEKIAALNLPFTNLQPLSAKEKAQKTLEAMAAGATLIYGGRIEAGDLLGEPDLLRKEGNGYVPVDIKSGSGEEGGEDEEPKLKKTYAIQLALYVDVLERLGLSGGRRGYIWDVHGDEVLYDLTEARGVRNTETWWAFYAENLASAQGIAARTKTTAPAYASGTCKLCHWYSTCLKAVKAADDLTLIPELGRSTRDVMATEIPTVAALAGINPEAYIEGKKTRFPNIGPAWLRKFQERARLLRSHDPKPYLKEPIQLPAHELELFFDIEVDPMRDLCYLHGFVERRRRDSRTEKYVAFFMADATAAAEEEAFAGAWRYINQSQPCSIYYYSKYERTIWRKLQAKYPGVCSAADIEALFEPANTVDLYFDVVRSKTEWPTNDFSIKTLAKYLGFKWRDTHPSGAASIQWFDEWVKTGLPETKQRILDYNEDDCIATRVVLDGIRELG
jgi:predicted RecB family nuclease